MNKLLIALLINGFCFNVLADTSKDLRGQAKENKLVIHVCNVDAIDRIKAVFTSNVEKILGEAKCSVLSDINYSTAVKSLANITASPVIRSMETIDVKRGADENGNVTGDTYWETCDAEDGDCIGRTMGAFDNPVENIYLITQAQQKQILSKLVENSSNQNTNVYFLKHEVQTLERNIEGSYTYHNLKYTDLLVK